MTTFLANFQKKFFELRLYLKNMQRGFILLNTNEQLVKNDITQMLKEEYTPLYEFDVEMTGLKALLDIELTEHKKYVLVYLPTEEEKLNPLLQQLNLMRDMLVLENVLYIFLAPVYARNYVIQELPNLYDYFELKQEYSTSFPVFFDALLPEYSYLMTKEEHMFVKRGNRNSAYPVQSNDIGDVYRELEYLNVVKKSIVFINKFLNNKIRPCLDVLKMENEEKEYVDIVLRTAKMLQKQRLYALSDKYYKHAEHEWKNYELPFRFYMECMLGMAYNAYYCGNYTDARNRYQELFVQLTGYEVNQELQCQLCNCISACDIQLKNYDSALLNVKRAISLEQNLQTNRERYTFANAYNHLLILLLENEDYIEVEYEEIIQRLDYDRLQVVEQALILTIQGWMSGVYLGKTGKGQIYLQKGLELKKQYFLENDIRMAESYYAVAVFWYMQGKINEARHCCQKCLNVLKNHSDATRKIALAKELSVFIEKMR